jgi:hypothetical protein
VGLLMLWRTSLLYACCSAVVWAACSGSSPTWTAASPEQSDLSDCLTAATSGDTIHIPAGSATWATHLVVLSTKDFTIVGAGIGQTIITCPATRCLTLSPNRTVDLSGFTFTGNSNFILHRWSPAVVGKYHRVHHNYFNRTGSGWGSIDIYGEPTSGCSGATQIHPTVLYDNNSFVNLRILTYGTACSTGEGSAQHRLWSQDPRPNAPIGTSTEITIVEDNVFHSTGALINAMDANQAGRYVCRFNQFTSDGNGSYLEVHGKQGGNRSVQWKEIYGNLKGPDAVANWPGLLYLRSGSGVIFNNRAPADVREMIIDHQRSYREDISKCDGTSPEDGNTPGMSGYPCRDQIGRIRDSPFTGDYAPQPELAPVYFWQNFKGAGTTQYVPEIQRAEVGVHVVENRDWYKQNASFDGTSGVGSGAIASRPSTCTTGVAYWATDEGEWNSRSPGLDGQLYKCTATNTWGLYYIPYTYPHPLQGIVYSHQHTGGSHAGGRQ